MHFADTRYDTISEEGKSGCHPEQNQSHVSSGCKDFAGIRLCFVQQGHTQSHARGLGWGRENFCWNCPFWNTWQNSISFSGLHILWCIWGFQGRPILGVQTETLRTRLPKSLNFLSISIALRSIFQTKHQVLSSCYEKVQERDTAVFKGKGDSSL